MWNVLRSRTPSAMNGYCFDTSAFMEPWNRWYPPDVFPSLWDQIGQQIEEESIVSPFEVKREIQAKNDPLYKWLRDRKKVFHEESDEVLEFMQREIFGVERFRRITETGRNGADPLVIAMAKVTSRVVVTNEQPVGPESTRIKIPVICDHFGIRWLRPLEYYREVGISL